MTESRISLLVILCAMIGCGNVSVYAQEEMSSEAVTIAKRVIGACIDFRKGARNHWDDILIEAETPISDLSQNDRIYVYTAIAVECSLDAAYGLAYHRIVWKDRVNLRAHLMHILGDVEGDQLSSTQRDRIKYAIEIAEIESPPDW